MNDAADTRRRILDGAHAALMHQGVRGLTVENAAVHAALSKGAVLYHFPNKHDLIKALLQQSVEDCTALVAAHGVAAMDSPAGERLCWALMAAASQHPEILRELDDCFGGLYRALPATGAVPPQTELLAQLARTFMHTFGLPLPPSP
jgi:AcrR family transcriptional regulator